jgi:hypothetical protein
MTAMGWGLMIGTWTVITVLLVYSFWRTLTVRK